MTWDFLLDQFESKDVGIDSYGNIYVVGRIELGLSEDVWIGIHNSDGDKLLNLTWGIIGGILYHERGNAIGLDSNNKIYVFGERYGVGNDCEQFLLKLTPYSEPLPIPPLINGGNGGDGDDKKKTVIILGYDVLLIFAIISLVIMYVAKKQTYIT